MLIRLMQKVGRRKEMMCVFRHVEFQALVKLGSIRSTVKLEV